MSWMNLFDGIDTIVKARKIPYSEVERLPFYEFKFILDKIKEESDKQKEEDEKQQKSYSKEKNKNQQSYKPPNYTGMMKNQQSQMKKFKPKY